MPEPACATHDVFPKPSVCRTWPPPPLFAGSFIVHAVVVKVPGWIVVVAPPKIPFPNVNIPVVVPLTPKPTLERAANELAVAPRETFVVPRVTELFCKFEFGRVGMSVAINERKAGVAAPPEVGPAKIKFAFSGANVTARVPLEVIGPPLTLKIAGTDIFTLVTVPVAVETHEVFPEPSVCSTCPFEPFTDGNVIVHAVAVSVLG